MQWRRSHAKKSSIVYWLKLKSKAADALNDKNNSQPRGEKRFSGIYYRVRINLTRIPLSLSTGINCTQPAIDDFPKDLFTDSERQQGAFVLHIVASLYLFVALALVCDKYFVPAVEKICGGE